MLSLLKQRNSAELKGVIFRSIKRLDKWLVQNEWKAYDPFDGLSAKNAKLLTLGNHYLRIILQQSVRRTPLNLRPILRIKKETSTKGMGFCASGYLKLYQATREKGYLQKVKFCLHWLKENYSFGYSGYAWGNHFTYESRGGRIPLDVPTIVWTSLIANVFLDTYEELGEKEYLDVAKKAGNFIVNDIGRYEDPDGSICFMYTPFHKGEHCMQGRIHNANILGGCLLGRLYQHTGQEELYTLSKKAIDYTVKHQLSDGAWYYGVEKKYWWIDSFHTGYVLDSLYCYLKATDDRSHEKSLRKGFEYFMSNFFKSDGTPKYYSHKTYPIDIQCPSQGIESLVKLRPYSGHSTEIAKRVASWTIKNMQDLQGYFYYRRYPMITNKTPMLHWGQATMLSALSHLWSIL